MPTPPDRPRVAPLILVGLAAGFLSGLFGVGGGVIVAPLLMSLGMPQRRAAGTSLAALMPVSLVGAAGYALTGQIDWVVAVLLAVGAVAGTQVGSLLLDRLPARQLFWAFVAFLVATAASLWIVTPSRTGTFDLDVASGIGVVVTGVIVGVLSALFGVGGGVIFVPALVVVFGVGDLVAKGSSLAAIVPGAVSGTIANGRRGNVDLAAAAWIGVSACVASPAGIALAFVLTPLVASIAFSALLVGITIQLVVRRLRSSRD